MSKELPKQDVLLSDNEVVEEKSFTCVICPQSCTITVGLDAQGQPAHIYGHTCKRGLNYGMTESTNPVRIVTAAVTVKGILEPLSVKTSAPVPMAVIPQVLEQTYAAAESLSLPIRIGDVLVAGVCGTDADIVATKSLG